MFERISNSWELVKASWSVLRSDKELVIFPIVSSVGVLIVTVTFAIPMVIVGFFQDVSDGKTTSDPSILGYILTFLFYLVMYSVIIYANTALVGAAMIRLQGGDPTLSDGFRAASQHLGSILGYALISATVGLILNTIARRGGILGQIASSLFGLAWHVATYLVVPILVTENIGPIDAVKRSTQLLKKTWGEQIVGNFSIGSVFGLLIFGVIIVGGGLTFMAVSLHSTALVIVVIVVSILGILGLSLVSSTLTGIYQAALYRYATQGDAGGMFNNALIQNAFRQGR